ncbi:MAG: baseplate J/gp47 family protein [Desulfopila sp.]
MSFAAEPYGVFVDDLVTALTGGTIREEFVYPATTNTPRLSAGDQYLRETVRLHGVADGFFKRFVLDKDYSIGSDGVISWLDTAALGSVVSVSPDPGSRFYVSYETKPGYKRQTLLTDRNPGSILRILSESFAREYAVLSRQLEKIYQAAFLETAENRDLDQVAALVGITRRDQKYAAGDVVFSRTTPAPADIVIPLGSLVSTADVPPVSVETLEQGILRAGTLSVSIRVRSTAEGSEGKAKAGSLTVIHRPVLGIETVTNPQALDFRGGREEDTVLRRRAVRALETSGRASTRALVGALMTLEGVREEDIGIKEDHLNHPGVVRITIAADLTEQKAARAVELINEYKPAGIRIQHNLKVSPPAELQVDDDALAPDGDGSFSGAAAVTADSIWTPVAVSLSLMPVDAALTSIQKAQIKDKVKKAVLDHIDSLGIDDPVIHNRVLSKVMEVEGVFDVALEIFDLGVAGQPRRKNLQPKLATRPQLKKENLTVTMRGSLVALDLDVTVTRLDLRTIDDAQTELGRVRDEIITLINTSLAAETRPMEITTASLTTALEGSGNFTVSSLSFKSEFLEEGLRLKQSDVGISVDKDQQPWVRVVTVADGAE